MLRVSDVLPWTGAAVGALTVLATASSVVATLVVPRRRRDRLVIAVDRVVDSGFRTLTRRIEDYLRRDHLLAAQASVQLMLQLATWLVLYVVGFGLLLWPWDPAGLGHALRQAGSSLFTLGYAAPTGTTATVVDYLAAAAGLIVVALQIGYLPTLYAAFNRRETEVTLLTSRAGLPAWGPELLARTRFGYQPNDRGVVMSDFYLNWERWAADVAESHSNYAVLTRFRSPAPYSSWLVGLVAVLDSAALWLALSPERAPATEARLALRMGFTCLRQIAATVGVPYDDDPDPDGELALTYEQFLDGVTRLGVVGFPMDRTPEQAWPDFRGWRVNYEAVAYALAYRQDSVHAQWTGPRRGGGDPVPPLRPPNRMPTRPGSA